VQVGTQVSGRIKELYADFNSPVKKGQLVAKIDPLLFEAAVEQANANYLQGEASLNSAKATASNADRQLDREKALNASNLASQQDLETAETATQVAHAQVGVAEANLAQARAQLNQAKVNLSYTSIISPIDGTVISRAVDVGQTVAASFQTPTLFTIANDLTKMQVLANIDEADVGKVHEGQEARFTVDAYPGDEFRGSIREVRQAPNTIQNVVTYAAVIDAANPERKLRQGMTSAVKVLTNHKDDVLRVPNAALRWKPDNAPAPEQPAQRGDRTLARTERRAAAPGTAAPGKPARLYKLEGQKPIPVDVRIGISDGQRTEVLGGLAETDAVIVGDSASGGGGARPQGGRRGPF